MPPATWLDFDTPWRTEPFWIDDPGDVINPNPGPTNAIAIPGTGVDSFPLQYFIATGTGVAIPVDAGNAAPDVKKVKFPRDKDANVVMFKLLDQTTDALEADTANAWRTGYVPTDSAPFGKEVHSQLGARLQGRDRWGSSIWVTQDSPHTVIQVGGTSPAGYLSDEVGEIDVVRFKKNKNLSHVVVGQPFPSGAVEFGYEVKTSAQGTLGARQRALYNSVFGTNGWRVMQPKRRFTDALGWVDHARGIQAREIYEAFKKAGKVAAAAFVLSIIISDINLDASAEEVLKRYRELARKIALPDGGGAAVQFGEALAQYVREFSGQECDAMMLGSVVYAYLATAPR